jgi:diacylglycerol kinase (ATP)
MSRKRIAFIINPNSGSNRSTNRADIVRKLMPADAECSVFEWNIIEDRDRIFTEVVNGNFDIAVAVGGDGTVSQLAHALCGTQTALGILPFGSGNGLARHIGIPMNTAAAMQVIARGQTATMDRGIINGNSFFCTAGTGFDARIGKLFATSTKRGFWTYAKITLRELSNYTPETCTVTVDGKSHQHNAFLITIANAGQYGNNAWIAPEAKVNDGILNVSVLNRFGWWQVPALVWRMFGKSIQHSGVVSTYSGKKISIERPASGPTHHDGEPAELDAKLEAEVEAGVLKVVVPEKFKG